MTPGLIDLRRIDLNLLVAFEALLTEQNVTRAADRIGIGQSAMSSTLGRLRKVLGDPILVQDGRRLVPTPLAESLLDPVRNILFEIQQVLSQRGEFNPAVDARAYSLLIMDYHLTWSFLQPLLARLELVAPNVRLHIEVPGADYADRLRRHEVDLLITPKEAFPGYSQLPHEILFHDRYVVVVDLDHPEIDDQISLEQFCTLPYLATWSGRNRSLVEDHLDFLGVPRNVEVTTDAGIAAFLLKGTRLILVLQERLARALAEVAHLKLLELPIEKLNSLTETMVWSERTDRDPGHRWLRQQVSDLAADMRPTRWSAGPQVDQLGRR